MTLRPLFFLCVLLHAGSLLAAEPDLEKDANAAIMRRVANIYISETFLNEQIKIFSAKSTLLKNLHLDLDAKSDRLYLSGTFQVPLEELQTVGSKKKS